MPLGINNVTTVTMDNITGFANLTNYPQFAASVNTQIYAGWLYFIILCLLAVILYVKLNDRSDQPLINAMYSAAAVTLVSLFLRGVNVYLAGSAQGLITDKQMWVFPIIAIVLAAVNWAIKDR